jgi:hypothetical protein
MAQARSQRARGDRITMIDVPYEPVYIDDATVSAGTVEQTDHARKERTLLSTG